MTLVGDASSYLSMLSSAIASTNSAASAVGTLINQITTYGTAMTDLAGRVAGAMAQVAQGFGITDEAVKFEHALVRATSVLFVNEQQLMQLREKALEVSKSGTRSASELAQAYYYLASAGLKAEQAMQVLDRVDRIAIAGMMDMKTTVRLMFDSLSVLGMKSKDPEKLQDNLARLSNVMLIASKTATSTMEEYGKALTSKGGAAMRTFNKDAEETMAVLTVMASRGLKGQLAGNTLARLVVMMAKASRAAPDMQRRFGFELWDKQTDQMKSMPAVLASLEGAIDGLGQHAVSTSLKLLGFENRTIAVIMQMMGSSQQMQEILDNYREISEARRDIVSIIRDVELSTTKSMGDRLTNDMRNLAIVVGEVLRPALHALQESLVGLIDWFMKLNPAIRNFTIGVALAFGAMSLLGGAITVVQLAAPVLIAAFAAFAGSIGIILTTIGALAGGLITFIVAPIATMSLVIGRLMLDFAALRVWAAGVWSKILVDYTALRAWMLANPLQVSLIGAAAVVLAFAVITAVLMRTIGPTKELNAELEKSKGLLNEITKIQSSKTDAIIAKGSKIEGPTERMKFYKEELKKAEKEAAGLKARMEADAAKIETGTIGSFGKWVFGKVFGDVGAAEQDDLNQSIALYKVVKERINQIKNAIIGLDEDFKKAQGMMEYQMRLMNLVTDFQEAIETLGMTEDEKKIFKFRFEASEEDLAEVKIASILKGMFEEDQRLRDEIDKLSEDMDEQVQILGQWGRVADVFKLRLQDTTGALSDLLDKLEARAVVADILVEIQELSDDVDELTRRLREQAETFFMTGHEADIYKLRIRGATDAQLDEAESLGVLIDLFETYQHIMDEGRKLTEHFDLPINRFNKRVKELQEMLVNGAITQQVFNRAVADAEKHLLKAGSAAEKLVSIMSGGVDDLIHLQSSLLDATATQNRGLGNMFNSGLPDPIFRKKVEKIVEVEAEGAEREAEAAAGAAFWTVSGSPAAMTEWEAWLNLLEESQEVAAQVADEIPRLVNNDLWTVTGSPAVTTPWEEWLQNTPDFDVVQADQEKLGDRQVAVLEEIRDILKAKNSGEVLLDPADFV